MTPKTIETTLGLNTQQSPKRWKKIVWGLFLLLLVSTVSYYTFNHSNKEKVTYITVPLKIQDLTTSVSATGNLEPTNTIDVGIEVSGTIDTVLVDYNDRVHSGQILARLDTTRLKAAVTSSQALLEKSQANEQSAKAAVDNASIENERARTMYASTNGNYPSRKEMQSSSTMFIQAKASLAAAKAQVAQSYAQLKSDEDNLKKAVVVSPIEGIVLARKVEPGQTVVAAMQTPVLFALAEDLTQMKALVSVDEADIGGVKENQKVLFTVDAYPNKEFEGKIIQLRLNSAIVNNVVTYEAVVHVNNIDLLLRPGMTASASIITDTLKNVTVLPNAALRFTPPLSDEEKKEKKKKHAVQEEDKGEYVWVLKNNIPTKTKVKIGKSDGISTVVTSSSLKIGDLIITGIDEQP
ncbi:MAG TPA: efflux RND transporter periplasmic adaptor subunit [Sulfuricurvum sp.]|nr:MAG: efflux transporter periplasmic adaptor subunit [Campylobacterales bacterium 16-40-21]OZA04191.1 MAG: efflux transporter periplasmic adaptor subunit [Sulfuricurvum sp. 17-40-25]HQS66202.1 efflux RND transporter periplasmic adaptor subunit [Sulfuricurvum sp.]HQT35566.1 efflux RND transporter periplasmic adaptor subunit [Sulfuricurvum sp.]